MEDLEQLQSPGGAGSTPNQVVRGVVCGTMAFAIKDNKKVPDDSEASHKWSCYVRGPDDYDISTSSSRWSSRCTPLSITQCGPSRVRRTRSTKGWGEFDIAIKLHFWPDSQLRPVEFIHSSSSIQTTTLRRHRPSRRSPW